MGHAIKKNPFFPITCAKFLCTEKWYIFENIFKYLNINNKQYVIDTIIVMYDFV